MGGLQTLYDISNSRAGQPTFGPRTHIVRIKWVLWDREGLGREACGKEFFQRR